jgi:hypothetical protein
MKFPGRFVSIVIAGTVAMPGLAAAEAAATAHVKPAAVENGTAALLRLCDPAHRAAAAKGEGVPEIYPASLREDHAAEIDSVSTFQAQGLDRKAADKYLATPAGQQLLKDLSAADPSSDADKIYARAVDQLGTGSNAPARKMEGAELVKIVPKGQSVSPYSPYFTTVSGLEAACRSKRGLADSFALPLKSEAATYDVYEIKPTDGHPDAFESRIAPTTELGGLVRRPGGAEQYIVPNRSQWSAPTLVGSIGN